MLFQSRIHSVVEAAEVSLSGTPIVVFDFENRAHAVNKELFQLFFEPVQTAPAHANTPVGRLQRKVGRKPRRQPTGGSKRETESTPEQAVKQGGKEVLLECLKQFGPCTIPELADHYVMAVLGSKSHEQAGVIKNRMYPLLSALRKQGLAIRVIHNSLDKVKAA